MDILESLLQRPSRIWALAGTAFAASLLGIIGIVGCDLPIEDFDAVAGGNYGGAGSGGYHEPQFPAPVNPSPGSPGQVAVDPTVVIGSFNIQSLGRSKMSKPDVVPILVDIIKRFDVLAVQELRDKDQRVIPDLLEVVNRDGSAYAASVGPRQGYIVNNGNAYYEQTVFLYDTRRIELVGPSFVAADPNREMHRAPYVARFRSRLVPAEQAFSFTLMNVHVDYEDAIQEFASLTRIIRSVFPMHPDEDDFILLGDLNESPSAFQKFSWLDNQVPAIPDDWFTNTAQSKTYDNIVFDSYRTAEFQRQSGVLNLMNEYGLSNDDAKQVSDHMPVWAVFSAYETMPATMVKSPQVIR